MIVVRYFAAIKDKIGQDQDVFDIEPGTNLKQIVDRICKRHPGVSEIFQTNNFLFAINQEMASLDTELKDDDEVAIFPPLSGG